MTCKSLKFGCELIPGDYQCFKDGKFWLKVVYYGFPSEHEFKTFKFIRPDAEWIEENIDKVQNQQ